MIDNLQILLITINRSSILDIRDFIWYSTLKRLKKGALTILKKRRKLKEDYNRETRRELIKRITRLMKKMKKSRMYARLLVIKLALQGKSYKEIVSITGISEPTIADYIKKFRKKGLAGLKMKYSSGCPSKLTKEQEIQLYEIIVNEYPKNHGFKAKMNWTVRIIRELIEKKFGVKYSRSGTRHLLHRLDLRFTTPTYTLAKADPKKQEEFKEQFNVLKQELLEGEIDHIFFVDESMIRDYQAISKTWFPKGQQKIIKTYGKHWGTKLIGALDYESGEVFCIQRKTYTAKEFLSFLKIMVKKYKDKRIVLVLDNAPIHHAYLLDPFLEEHAEHLTLFFLPPYSPQLNLIEGLWGWLKENVINNEFFDSALKIHRAVKEFIDWVNDNPQETIDRLCVRL